MASLTPVCQVTLATNQSYNSALHSSSAFLVSISTGVHTPLARSTAVVFFPLPPAPGLRALTTAGRVGPISFFNDIACVNALWSRLSLPMLNKALSLPRAFLCLVLPMDSVKFNQHKSLALRVCRGAMWPLPYCSPLITLNSFLVRCECD